MKKGFIPIAIECYIDSHLKLNASENRQELSDALVTTLQLYQNGFVCSQCGHSLWVIGSAITRRLGCFTCITGELEPSDDYELVEACEGSDRLKPIASKNLIKTSEIIPENKWCEVADISESVTGIKYSSKEWKLLFEKSLLKVFVWEGERIIGFGRTVGIQQLSIVMDVFVRPEYRGKDWGNFIAQFLVKKGKSLSWNVGISAVSDEEFNYETGRINQLIHQRKKDREAMISHISATKLDDDDIMDILINVIAKLSNKKDWIPCSNVARSLINQGIYIKKYQYSKFKELILEAEKRYLIETKHEKKTWYVKQK